MIPETGKQDRPVIFHTGEELRSDCVQRLKDRLLSYRELISYEDEDGLVSGATSDILSLEDLGIDIDKLAKHILTPVKGRRPHEKD